MVTNMVVSSALQVRTIWRASLLAVLVTAVCVQPAHSDMRVHFINVGQGDATLFEFTDHCHEIFNISPQTIQFPHYQAVAFAQNL